MGWYNAGGWRSNGWAVAGGGGGAYANSETTAWAAAVVANGGSVNADANGAHVDALITGLKSDGLFTLLDRLWIHCLANESQVQGRVSVVKGGASVPADSSIACVSHGTPTAFDANGYQGDASTAYLDSGFNPSTNGVNFTGTANSAFQYIRNTRTATADAKITFGINNGSTVVEFIPWSHLSESLLYDLSTVAAIPTTNTSTQGSFTMTRLGTNVVRAVYNEGTAVSNGGDTPASLPSLNFFIGGRNTSGSLDSPSDDTIAATGFGGALTDTQMVNLEHRVNALLTSLGKNVY